MFGVDIGSHVLAAARRQQAGKIAHADSQLKHALAQIGRYDIGHPAMYATPEPNSRGVRRTSRSQRGSAERLITRQIDVALFIILFGSKRPWLSDVLDWPLPQPWRPVHVPKTFAVILPILTSFHAPAAPASVPALTCNARVLLRYHEELNKMSSPKVLDYGYSHTHSTWDHSIVLPPIIRAAQSTPSKGSILDIGCGGGAMLAEIQKLGPWRLCGVESSETAVSLARSQGFDVRLADATTELDTLFEQNSFDLIISVEVIEHVYDPRGLLRQAHTLLRPRGRLLLTTPYHGYLKNLLIAALGKSDAHYNPLWDCGHIKFWSRKTLSTALEETGYQDIQFYGAGRWGYLWKSMVLTATAP